MKMSIHEVYYDVNGVRLRALHVGDSTAMPVIFLHGFPEYADIWHSYLHDVAAAGCYTIAIEQRGYNLSDKPHGIDAYDVDQLAADVAIIIEHELGQPAVVIGHDWGGAVAWHLAATQPQHVQHLVILNVPHPAVLAHNLQQSPQQRRKSWYMYFFQVPVIPEMIFGGNRGWLMRQMAAALIRDGQLGSLTKADIANYRRAWGQPGAMRAAMNWYRAFFKRMGRGDIHTERIRVPAHILWGAQDVVFEGHLAEDSLSLCDHGTLTYFERAGHFVHHQEREAILAIMLSIINPLITKQTYQGA